MTESGHKVVVALEGFLLAAPVTYLGASLGVAAVMSIFHEHSEPYERAQALVYLLPLLPLACGWALLTRFFLRGYSGLLSTSPYVWWTAIAGVALVILAVPIGASFDVHALEIEDSPSFWQWVALYFRELALGFPAVIPLAHLLILRQKQLSSEAKLHAL